MAVCCLKSMFFYESVIKIDIFIITRVYIYHKGPVCIIVEMAIILMDQLAVHDLSQSTAVPSDCVSCFSRFLPILLSAHLTNVWTRPVGNMRQVSYEINTEKQVIQ